MKSFAFLVFMCAALQLQAEVKLPAIFSDHMVLQRNVEVPVWGWAEAGERVSISFGRQTVTAQADSEGKWSTKLAKLEASAKPRELTVKGSTEINLKNVLVGDVWICSGQSNMEWPLKRSSKNPVEVVVAFNNIDKGLTTTDGEKPTFFELAGSDEVFVPAEATIKGDTVVLKAEAIRSPQYVRMGWNETSVPNLADKNGWPVFQFPGQEIK